MSELHREGPSAPPSEQANEKPKKRGRRYNKNKRPHKSARSAHSQGPKADNRPDKKSDHHSSEAENQHHHSRKKTNGHQADGHKSSSHKSGSQRHRSNRNASQRSGQNHGFEKQIQTRYSYPPRRRKPIYSAIDLGTNNCRLLIAKPTVNGFRVIDAFSRIVRLGQGVEATGMLSEEAMDRTVEALKICAEKIARRGVTTMHHVATEACRKASNTDAFIERVRLETGININVISAADEARLAVMGCQSLIAQGHKHALVFDIGGGSTELIWVKVTRSGRTDIQGWTSIPWGVVNLTEKFGAHRSDISSVAFTAMVSEVAAHLHDFENAYQISDIVDNSKVQLLGTSGTVTTLASLHLNLPRYDRNQVDGAWMQARDIQDLSRNVASMSYIQRAAQPCIGEERADLVVAGCAILEAILGMWPVDNLRIADRGIREGILRSLMQRQEGPKQGWRQNNRPKSGQREDRDHDRTKDRHTRSDGDKRRSKYGGDQKKRSRHHHGQKKRHTDQTRQSD